MQGSLRAFAAIAAFLLSASAFADPPVYTGLFSSRAVSGYDTVAYFTEGRPVKGERRFSTEYEGATWLFSSAENLARFEADPEAYAPQYGGYCAWAVSQGYTASGDPDNWAIEDGKLYLNYDDDVQATWNEDRAGFIELADENWPSLVD
ncbi:MAG: YHS domain-containing (seleno)protein [Pseudomonadales bacterium]|jgi:YHS domain-containing protein|nr:YHS domain-containing (seleno)protein [Pseudomonadales bacterium]